jgi:hypothetical protein
VGPLGQADAFGRLLAALEAADIRFLVIGMSAAIAQGVMGATLDIDLWIDLPARQYMRVQTLAHKTGATIGANTVVYLDDGIPVNFVYDVTGLGDFSAEWKHQVPALLHGRQVPVLKLTRIQKSKQAIRRDKDLLHIRLIADFLKCQRQLKRAGARPRPPRAQ